MESSGGGGGATSQFLRRSIVVIVAAALCLSRFVLQLHAKRRRIVFMGTPDFAIPSLETLTREFTVAAVYTRPDKPAGRGRGLAESPVKQFAVAHNLTVEQPRTLRVPEAQARLREIAPDLIVVAAYGLILPQA